MAVQTKLPQQRVAANYTTGNSIDISPRYRPKKKLQSIEQAQKIYEIWNDESVLFRTAPIYRTVKRKEPQPRYVETRAPIVIYDDEQDETEFDDDDDDDNDDGDGYNDERIMYARQPRQTIKKTCLPPNVRMICVRENTKRIPN